MRKNHETTTLLVAMAAIAATLLAAGTVAALGSNQFAFAHREYKKSYGQDNNYGREDKYGKDQGRSDGSQYLKCIVVGGGGGEIKRGDSGMSKADAAQTPDLTSKESSGISDNSCNNYDSGVLKTVGPMGG